jgi:PIN domain nuclease of toxin-antitoxin system
LENEISNLYISQISLLEIAIKLNIGKLVGFKITMGDFIKLIKETRIEILPVKNEHIAAYSIFNFHIEHRDPFDRYIIATSYVEQKAIITCDEKFDFYSEKIEIIW